MAAIPTEVLSSKAYKKAEKLLGREHARAMLEKDDEVLKTSIGQCVSEMTARDAELKQNQDFRRSQDVIKTLRGGLRDTNKPEKAVIDLAKEIIQLRNV